MSEQQTVDQSQVGSAGGVATDGEGKPTTSDAPEQAAKQSPTKYHVLKRVTTPAGSPSQVEETWAIVTKNVEAQSAEAAKKKVAAALTGGTDESVELVAVPARSWTPQTASVKTSHQLVLS